MEIKVIDSKFSDVTNAEPGRFFLVAIDRDGPLTIVCKATDPNGTKLMVHLNGENRFCFSRVPHGTRGIELDSTDLRLKFDEAPLRTREEHGEIGKIAIGELGSYLWVRVLGAQDHRAFFDLQSWKILSYDAVDVDCWIDSWSLLSASYDHPLQISTRVA